MLNSALVGVVIGTVAALFPDVLPVTRDNVWSIGFCTLESPLDPAPCVGTLEASLDAAHVTDVDALFVADPFLASDSSGFYAFYEVLNSSSNHGDIAVSTSTDGLTWTYGGLVLDEDVHLSYPHVFSEGGRWFMTPESEAANHVALFEATNFPLAWERSEILVEGVDLADPTLFKHEGRWWMFVGRAGAHDQLRLFHSDKLRTGWTEHPSSPLIVSDARISRPAGRVLDLDGTLYRLAQNSEGRYGREVRAFEITELSATNYSERPIDQALLGPGVMGWNAAGMHHLDALQRDSVWLVAVDGHRKELRFRAPTVPALLTR